MLSGDVGQVEVTVADLDVLGLDALSDLVDVDRLLEVVLRPLEVPLNHINILNHTIVI